MELTGKIIVVQEAKSGSSSKTGNPQPIQPAKDDLPFYPNSESFPFQENGDDGGDLPF